MGIVRRLLLQFGFETSSGTRADRADLRAEATELVKRAHDEIERSKRQRGLNVSDQQYEIRLRGKGRT